MGFREVDNAFQEFEHELLEHVRTRLMGMTGEIEVRDVGSSNITYEEVHPDALLLGVFYKRITILRRGSRTYNLYDVTLRFRFVFRRQLRFRSPVNVSRGVRERIVKEFNRELRNIDWSV